ncbi:helix-turn-helix domain-containing protein [Clostridium hydrogenum]|uniref:helix-turn-helix domain-containing protein n=1 Tax=Clostridium hydrogenum TaxID=2855764 RepID=UPI001F3EF3DF|nr:AraC family transcriptional regulator [Clostridium hydrogenum]
MDKINSYKLRIEAALEYLDNNIDSDLSLQALSKIAGFSPYHFHRIFYAITGTSLHEYVLTRKLNIAASQLLYETCDITKIALDSGFSTPSAFSKNFKKLFRCTPTQYKAYKERKYPVRFAKISFPEYTYDSHIDKCFYETTLSNLKTLCIGVTGLSESFENPEIEKAYHEIFYWLKKNPLNSEIKICGITVDTPEVQALDSCKYYACAAVKDYVFTDTLTFRTFKTSGQYICCKMNRNQKNFAEIFFKYMRYLYGFYLVQHQLLPDFRPFVEFYGADANNNITITFCVPVKKARNEQ